MNDDELLQLAQDLSKGKDAASLVSLVSQLGRIADAMEKVAGFFQEERERIDRKQKEVEEWEKSHPMEERPQ